MLSAKGRVGHQWKARAFPKLADSLLYLWQSVTLITESRLTWAYYRVSPISRLTVVHLTSTCRARFSVQLLTDCWFLLLSELIYLRSKLLFCCHLQELFCRASLGSRLPCVLLRIRRWVRHKFIDSKVKCCISILTQKKTCKCSCLYAANTLCCTYRRVTGTHFVHKTSCSWPAERGQQIFILLFTNWLVCRKNS